MFFQEFSCEFPGDLAVRILGFHCRGPDSVPHWGTEIPQAVQHSQKKKKNFLPFYVLSIESKFYFALLCFSRRPRFF